MKVLKPLTLSILNESVPETEAPLWASGVTYKPGTEDGNDPTVMHKHYVYLCIAENTDKPPDQNSDIDGAPWRTLSVTNKYACIDLYNYTQTIAPEGQATLVIQVPFERPAQAVGLLNMKATNVRVILTATTDYENGEILWDSSQKDLLSDSTDWWDYFFGGFNHDKDVVFSGIIPVTGVLTVILEGARPAIGNILVGRMHDLGSTQYGVGTGIIDYSLNTTNGFGQETWIKRHNAKRATFPVFVPPEDIDRIQKVLADMAGVPALWVGDDGTGFESMTIFGFNKDSEIRLDGPSKGQGNIEIRGIV